jgi:hypothetical protein
MVVATLHSILGVLNFKGFINRQMIRLTLLFTTLIISFVGNF